MGGRGASIQIKKPNNIKPNSVKKIEETQKPFASDAFKRLTVINSKAFLKIKEHIDITDSEVDISASQWLHIVERHGNDKEFIFSNLKKTVKNPDILITDEKDKNTILLIKHIAGDDKNLVAIAFDKYRKNGKIKNRVKSARRITTRELERMGKKKRFNILHLNKK